MYPCGKAPPTACGRDDDERRARQTDVHNSSGCRPVLSGIVKNFRPDTGPKDFLSALTATVPQRAGRVTRRAAAQAEDGVAVDATGLLRLAGVFGVWADFQQQGRSLYLYSIYLLTTLYVGDVFSRRSRLRW